MRLLAPVRRWRRTLVFASLMVFALFHGRLLFTQPPSGLPNANIAQPAPFVPQGASPTPTAFPTPSATPTGTPTPTPCAILAEDFDGVSVPSFPSGWVASNAINPDNILWVTSTVSPDSPPNAAFINDPSAVSDKRLDTPGFFITSSRPLVSFRHSYALDPVGGGPAFRDGAVLEVSAPNIAGGAFTDIRNPLVGGSFVTGGYNGTISTASSNPIGGRMAWGQSSGGYITTVAELGPHITAQTVKLRFRMCSDSSVAGTGWFIDNVVVNGASGPPCPTPTPVPTSTPGILCISDTWSSPILTNAPAARYRHVAVWSGTEMIIWGGQDTNIFRNDGGNYDLASNSWIPMSTAGAPTGRSYATAVWTGTDMIVWGGFDSNLLNTGGKYNPSMDNWIATPTTDAPNGRYLHSAIWTGTEMIVWGGVDQNFELTNKGGKFDPATNSWIATTTTNAPTARSDHTAVWTGTEMIIWGGSTNTGGRYNPTTNTWTPTTMTNAPITRSRHTAVWTGNEMIIWGGGSNIGGRYNPATDSWTSTSNLSAPTDRSGAIAIWTGTEMIVWGGRDAAGLPSTGGRYNPTTDSWLATSTTNSPQGREFFPGIWTGAQMIVWGGSRSGPLNTGGVYCAPSIAATATPTPGSTVAISGVTSYCSNPAPAPVSAVTMTLTGTTSGSTSTDSAGFYSLSGLFSGGTYTVTPTKAALSPGFSQSINTIDLLAVQRHFLKLGQIPPGCRLTAANVNGDATIDTVDVIAIQRFYLGQFTGIANVGKYQFAPGNRTYSGIVTDQTNQNYGALVFGDVVAPFADGQ